MSSINWMPMQSVAPFTSTVAGLGSVVFGVTMTVIMGGERYVMARMALPEIVTMNA
ncbi:hypothetical protein LGKMAHEF_03708 [Aeromonas salmonicida]